MTSHRLKDCRCRIYHCGDVNDPLHRLGPVDAPSQQALRIQAGLGISVAESGQESSFASHAGHFGMVWGRASDLGHCGAGAIGPAVTVAAATTATAAVAVTAATPAPAPTPTGAWARRPAPGRPSLETVFFSRQDSYLLLEILQMFLIVGHYLLRPLV